MDLTSEVFKRANLQCIAQYLQSGTDPVHMDTINHSKSFDKRLKETLFAFNGALKSAGIDEDSELFKSMWSKVNEMENIYMEVGIICGFKIIKLLEMNKI